MLEPTNTPPDPEAGTVYLFEIPEQDPDACPKVFFIHQHGNTWTAERNGNLQVVNVERVRDVLRSAFDLGIPIVALDKKEFFRRLNRARHPLSHANRN